MNALTFVIGKGMGELSKLTLNLTVQFWFTHVPWRKQGNCRKSGPNISCKTDSIHQTLFL